MTRSPLSLAPASLGLGFGLLAALFVVVGCGPKPAETCAKYEELRASDGRPAKDSDAEACVEALTQYASDNPEATQCVHGCIANASNSKAADECPWSCESQYGGVDGKGAQGLDAQLAVKTKWARGLVGDGLTEDERSEQAEARAKQAILAAGAPEARAIEACVAQCRPETSDRLRDDHNACFEACMTDAGFR